MDEKKGTTQGTLKLVRTSHEKPRIRNHEVAVEGHLIGIPAVGSTIRFTGEGLIEGIRCIETSTVVNLAWGDEGFKAETLNSVYEVKLAVSAEDLAKLRSMSEAIEAAYQSGSVTLTLAVEAAS